MANPHKINLGLCLTILRKLAEAPTCYETIRKHVIRTTACGSSGKLSRAIRDVVSVTVCVCNNRSSPTVTPRKPWR